MIQYIITYIINILLWKQSFIIINIKFSFFSFSQSWQPRCIEKISEWIDKF